MATDSRNATQRARHNLAARAFRQFARLARTERYEQPDEITPAMKAQVARIWELHHAITLNEGW